MSKPQTKKTHNGIRVGDLITSYFKGIWRLTKIECRYVTQWEVDHYHSYKDKKAGDEHSPLFHFESVLNSKLKKVGKTQVKSCDAGYCRKIDGSYFQSQMDEKEKEFYDFLKGLGTLAEVYRENGGTDQIEDYGKFGIEFC